MILLALSSLLGVVSLFVCKSLMSWEVIFSEFNKEAVYCNNLTRFNFASKFEFEVVAISMCVPSRLSSLERLEIPESIRENAMLFIRVSRVGKLGAQSAFVILSKLSVGMDCPWSVRRKLL